MKAEGFLENFTSSLLSNGAKIFIHFQLANRDNFQDLDKFLGWFCANVGLGLQLGNQIA
ncbi:AAA-like domain-containing protein [Microcoleus vaginatus]|uniref:AAA-like domain-containing protein n=1 Tax=Microcoleus vaginatus TaxID=119532 RepID=UPI004040B0AA